MVFAQLVSTEMCPCRTLPHQRGRQPLLSNLKAMLNYCELSNQISYPFFLALSSNPLPLPLPRWDRTKETSGVAQ